MTESPWQKYGILRDNKRPCPTCGAAVWRPLLRGGHMDFSAPPIHRPQDAARCVSTNQHKWPEEHK